MIDPHIVPPGFVQNVRDRQAARGEPVRPRLAATTVLVRGGTPGVPGSVEVFLQMRPATMAFAASALVFPGGSVDKSDAQLLADEAAPAWVGPAPAAWAQRLDCSEPMATAIVCAAARELFEEAGVLLAGPVGGVGPAGGMDAAGDAGGAGIAGPASDGGREGVTAAAAYRDADGDGLLDDLSDPTWEEARVALETRQTSMSEFLRGRGLAFRSDLLAPWRSWLTPEFEPKRFNAQFLVAAAPEGQVARTVSGETTESLWIPVGELLPRVGTEYQMLAPQIFTCAELYEFDSAAAVVESARTTQRTGVMPRLGGTAEVPRLEFLPELDEVLERVAAVLG